MKKRILAICSAALCAVCAGFVTACEKYVHEHDYGTAWEKSAAHHWHECRNAGCDKREADKAAHADNNGDGKCDVCEYVLFVPEVPVANVTLNKTELSLEAGEAETLIATVLPENATERAVAWESNESEVASVDKSGKVTAIAPGTAKITATADGKSTACTVTVTPKIIAVTGITLNKTETELEIGETETLTATLTPDNATDKTVTWTVAPAGVVSVENGIVTALKDGTATITATANGKSANCSVTVNAPITNADIISALDANCKDALITRCLLGIEHNKEDISEGNWYLIKAEDGSYIGAEYIFTLTRSNADAFYTIGKVTFDGINAKDLANGNFQNVKYSNSYMFNYAPSNQEQNKELTNAICETLFGTQGDNYITRYIVDGGDGVGDSKLGYYHNYTVIEISENGVNEKSINIKKNSVTDSEYISKLSNAENYNIVGDKSYTLLGEEVKNNNEPFLA